MGDTVRVVPDERNADSPRQRLAPGSPLAEMKMDFWRRVKRREVKRS